MKSELQKEWEKVILRYQKGITNEEQKGQCQSHITATACGSLVRSIQPTLFTAEFWLSAPHHLFQKI